MARVYKAGPKINHAPNQAIGRSLGKRPMEGKKSFKKQRQFDTLQDALDAGYVPITENPLDMVLLKVREMRRYLMAQRIKNELKATKLVKFKRASRPMPDGYAKIDDRAFTVMAPRGAEGEQRIRGDYVAPVDVARVVNNFLSPGPPRQLPVRRLRLDRQRAEHGAARHVAFHAGSSRSTRRCRPARRGSISCSRARAGRRLGGAREAGARRRLGRRRVRSRCSRSPRRSRVPEGPEDVARLHDRRVHADLRQAIDGMVQPVAGARRWTTTTAPATCRSSSTRCATSAG
jgi:hypothetical protein